MEEFEKYKVRMGYNEGQMKSVRYRMSVYDDFLKEYDYRRKVKGLQRTEQKTAKKKEIIVDRIIRQTAKVIIVD